MPIEAPFDPEGGAYAGVSAKAAADRRITKATPDTRITIMVMVTRTSTTIDGWNLRRGRSTLALFRLGLARFSGRRLYVFAWAGNRGR